MANTPTKIKFKDLQTKLPGRLATPDEAVISLPANPQIAQHLARVHNSGMVDHVPVTPTRGAHGHEPSRPNTLPAVISKGVSTQLNEPKWHAVKNLPGYMATAIRALGRQVFGQFTTTPIEDIHVLSTMTNSDYELNAVGTWIKRHAHKDTEATMKFERLFPGYEAEVDVWHADGYTFVVVIDPFGHYIYAWPTSTDKIK